MSKLELVSRRSGIGLEGLPKVLADAVDNDPFEIIGFAAIAGSALQDGVGKLFDELAEEDPRLGPVLWATVAELPLIDHLACSKPIVEEVLPDWLWHLDDTTVTGIMRRTKRNGRASTYLVEVAMVPEIVATCVFEVKHHRRDEVVGFQTIAEHMGDVVDYKQQKFRQAKDEVFESVYLGEGVQELLMALDGSLHEGPAVRCKLPWPMNLPTALLVVELATREVHSIDDFPYLAARQSAGASSPIARKLRRSLRSVGGRA